MTAALKIDGELTRGLSLPRPTAVAPAATGCPATLRLLDGGVVSDVPWEADFMLKRTRIMRKMLMPSPLAWVGGKRRLRETIISRFCDHQCYVEGFGGGGWVLFGKTPSPVEIYNDLDGELVNFWRVIQQRREAFLDELKRVVSSREIFRVLKSIDTCYMSELVRAVRFYYLHKDSFAAKGNHYATGTGGFRFPSKTAAGAIQAASERLALVRIENMDWRALLARYDSIDTLFYLDPPYVDTPGSYVHEFVDRDHRDLAAALAGVRGRWLLSYGNHPLVRELYSGARIEEVEVGYTMSPSRASRQPRIELLISNY